MQLNNLKLNITFLCAFAPLRLGGIKFVRLCEQNNRKNEKNIKKQQKTDYFENTTKPSDISGEPAFPGTLIWRNEPNFNTSNIIATSYITVGYNDFFQNSTKKTNPIKANLKPISNTTKPSLFSGEPALLQNLFLRNKPNLSSQKFTASPCSTVVYNAFSQKPKNGANPNEPNLKPISNTTKTSLLLGEPAFSSTLICKNKPNFPDQRNTANSCCESAYNDFYPEIPKKTNPKQTQTNPISDVNPIFVSSLFSH